MCSEMPEWHLGIPSESPSETQEPLSSPQGVTAALAPSLKPSPLRSFLLLSLSATRDGDGDGPP